MTVMQLKMIHLRAASNESLGYAANKENEAEKLKTEKWICQGVSKKFWAAEQSWVVFSIGSKDVSGQGQWKDYSSWRIARTEKNLDMVSKAPKEIVEVTNSWQIHFYPTRNPNLD